MSSPSNTLNDSKEDNDVSFRVTDGPLAQSARNDLSEVSTNEGGWDDEDEINQELIRLAEYDAEPGQEDFFGEVVADCVS